MCSDSQPQIDLTACSRVQLTRTYNVVHSLRPDVLSSLWLPACSVVPASCSLLLLHSAPLHRGPAADRADEELFVISTEGLGQEGAVPIQSGRCWHQLKTHHSENIQLTLSDGQRSGKRKKRTSTSKATLEVNLCTSDSESSEYSGPSVTQFKRSRLGRKALHRATKVLATGAECDVERVQRGGGEWDVWDTGGDPKEETEEKRMFLQMTGKNKPKVRKRL